MSLVLTEVHSNIPNFKVSAIKSHPQHLPTFVCCSSACRTPQEPSFWGSSPNKAKEWVFCGSALSVEEKVS